MADVGNIAKHAAEQADKAPKVLERAGLDGERLREETRQATRLHDVGKERVVFQAIAAPADYAQQLGAEQREAATAAFGALHSETVERIAEQLGADGIGDLVRQLNTPGLSALADVAGQVGVAQRSALNDALRALRKVAAPGLQGIAEQIASLERDRLGEIAVSELRELAEQIAAIREDLSELGANQALARVNEEIEEAILAPAIEAARAINDGRFANLDALDAATAYWSASYAALPKELRSKVKAPGVHLTPEQSAEEFDRRARRLMNMSGEEFVRRWEAGEFRDKLDHPEHPEILDLVMLLPLAR